MFKKFVSIMLSIVLFCSLGIVASATTAEKDVYVESLSHYSEIQPRYEYTSNCTASIGISNNKANCTATLQGYSNTTKIEITMTLQKKSLLWWSKVDSWSTTVNGFIGSLSKSSSISSGTYRTKAVFKVYNGSNSESITIYSQEKTN